MNHWRSPAADENAAYDAHVALAAEMRWIEAAEAQRESQQHSVTIHSPIPPESITTP